MSDPTDYFYGKKICRLSAGYRGITFRNGKKKWNILVHILVWSEAHGDIPPGHDIHHIDEDKTNNALSNLQLMTRREHQRHHAGGWLQLHGKTLKRCNTCHRELHLKHFSQQAQPCRACLSAECAYNDRQRRFRTSGAVLPGQYKLPGVT